MLTWNPLSRVVSADPSHYPKDTGTQTHVSAVFSRASTHGCLNFRTSRVKNRGGSLYREAFCTYNVYTREPLDHQNEEGRLLIFGIVSSAGLHFHNRRPSPYNRPAIVNTPIEYNYWALYGFPRKRPP